MEVKQFNKIYQNSKLVNEAFAFLKSKGAKLQLSGIKGSLSSVLSSAICSRIKRTHLFILEDKESAAYFFNDLEFLMEDRDKLMEEKHILFYPTSYRKSPSSRSTDNLQALMRTEVLKRISTQRSGFIIVSYPEAIGEKVISRSEYRKHLLTIESGKEYPLDFIYELLSEFEYEQVDFVVEPGQFAVRGGIIDVFSFSHENPYRIEFVGDTVDSLRTFDPSNQLSIDTKTSLDVIPNLHNVSSDQNKQSFIESIHADSFLWAIDFSFAHDRIQKQFDLIISDPDIDQNIKNSIINGDEFIEQIISRTCIELGPRKFFQNAHTIAIQSEPQPLFHKKFDLLIQNLEENEQKGFENIFLSTNQNQIKRIRRIFEDVQADKDEESLIHFSPLNIVLHQGFVDHENKLLCYTDHQIFDRYQKFFLRQGFKAKESLTLKELYDLKKGDFVTHVDHGVGRFDGLERITNNGRHQEAIRLIYRDSDLLYVSIHSLHRISKFSGRDGTPPTLNKLGTKSWENTKKKAKSKLKDIARDLIKLYAKRKSASGFAFAPDTYLQHELEASFLFEDTPDQQTATAAVKADMEAENPMDRLICGDVGFGKTEVAIRAAFKAVTDSKQVAVLVPTTILALQHFKTFSKRLEDFPCKIEYLNRFKSAKAQKEVIEGLKQGKVDIVIGTHRLVSKDIEFKDLGLLIVDEEQKFGVSVKEKLKQIKVNVDTLTLSATPIPRTMQFSLMGARDMSIIRTAPPNRYPVQTETYSFDKEIIRRAIDYEVSRGGQVYFLHNRVQNIDEIASTLLRLVPGITVAVGHGQMEGRKLEKIMLDFIDGHYDVLVATTIIENGLDIPNANTIIINEAHHFGLSDLHQLRGRVGRSNKKASCYLIAPPLQSMTDEARKRMRAITEFSGLGSGFNIAMRDLEIRGAGNILGAEQSGFISEIGYDMYQKIIDEALTELKETEFSEEYANDQTTKIKVKDCNIETDFEVMIPQDYVTNVSERLRLYSEIDEIKETAELKLFTKNMIDRFGPLQASTSRLLELVEIRWLAQSLGFLNLILKSNRMIISFDDTNPQYVNSPVFAGILQFVKENPSKCRFSENKEKTRLVLPNIHTVHQANEVLQLIKAAI